MPIKFSEEPEKPRMSRSSKKIWKCLQILYQEIRAIKNK